MTASYGLRERSAEFILSASVPTSWFLQSYKAPFQRPFGEQARADAARQRFAQHKSDHLAIVEAFAAWRNKVNVVVGEPRSRVSVGRVVGVGVAWARISSIGKMNQRFLHFVFGHRGTESNCDAGWLTGYAEIPVVRELPATHETSPETLAPLRSCEATMPQKAGMCDYKATGFGRFAAHRLLHCWRRLWSFLRCSLFHDSFTVVSVLGNTRSLLCHQLRPCSADTSVSPSC